MAKKNAPLSPRVPGAVAGGGVGTAVGYVVAWALGAFVFGVGDAGDKATAAIAAVPWPVLAVVLIIVPGVCAWIGGYLPRDLASDLYEAQQADPVAEEAPMDFADAGAAPVVIPPVEPGEAGAGTPAPPNEEASDPVESNNTPTRPDPRHGKK